MTEINWNDVLDEQASDMSEQLAPDGDYDVVVKKADATKASTGSPMIKLVVEVSTGPYKGKGLFTQLVFKTDSPGAMRMSLAGLRALGFDTDRLRSENPPLAKIAAELVGNDAVAVVDSREWNDEMRNNVKKFKPAGSVSGVPPAPSIGAAPTVASVPAPPAPEVPPAPSIPDAVEAPPAPEVPAPPAAPETETAPPSDEPF